MHPADFTRLRPFAYHLTARANLPVIQSAARLDPAATILPHRNDARLHTPLISAYTAAMGHPRKHEDPGDGINSEAVAPDFQRLMPESIHRKCSEFAVGLIKQMK